VERNRENEGEDGPSIRTESRTPPRMAHNEGGESDAVRRAAAGREREKRREIPRGETKRRDRRCFKFSEQSAASTAAEPVSRSCSRGGSLRRHSSLPCISPLQYETDDRASCSGCTCRSNVTDDARPPCIPPRLRRASPFLLILGVACISKFGPRLAAGIPAGSSSRKQKRIDCRSFDPEGEYRDILLSFSLSLSLTTKSIEIR